MTYTKFLANRGSLRLYEENAKISKKRKLILGNSLKLKDKTKDTHARDRQSPEAATRGVLQKKLFLEISQNSQENTGARVSLLIKPATLLIKRL